MISLLISRLVDQIYEYVCFCKLSNLDDPSSEAWSAVCARMRIAALLSLNVWNLLSSMWCPIMDSQLTSFSLYTMTFFKMLSFIFYFPVYALIYWKSYFTNCHCHNDAVEITWYPKCPWNLRPFVNSFSFFIIVNPVFSQSTIALRF